MSAVAAVIGCAAAFSACGGDDGADVGQLTITASGSGNDVTYEVDTEEIGAGATEITLVNDTEGDTDGQLVYTAEERSDDEVLEQLGNAIEGEAVEDWFEGGGGPASTAAGESSSATQELKPGTYYIAAGEEPPEQLVSFTVTEEDGAELPDADGSVEAIEYSFSADGLSAGENAILLENNGEEWHHFIGSKLADDASIEDVEEFFRTEEGPPPFEDAEAGPSIQSTVLEGGVSQVVDLEFEEGTYAFICFISDKAGGKSHAELGMVSEVEVAAE